MEVDIYLGDPDNFFDAKREIYLDEIEIGFPMVIKH